jgi:8-oxo-dGTP pyrophosphatase MutT (NUDIX family)
VDAIPEICESLREDMKNSEIKIVNENIVYENEYGQLYDDDVMFLPQEIPGKYVRWKWNTSYSVGILPITKDNEFILIESYRHAARKSVIEVPKGYGEDGVDPLEMAKRELAEETGLESDRWEYLGEVLADTSFTYHPMKLFIAWDCRDANLTHYEDSEAIIAKYKYPLASIPELTKKPAIYDLVTLFMLMSVNQKR